LRGLIFFRMDSENFEGSGIFFWKTLANWRTFWKNGGFDPQNYFLNTPLVRIIQYFIYFHQNNHFSKISFFKKCRNLKFKIKIYLTLFFPFNDIFVLFWMSSSHQTINYNLTNYFFNEFDNLTRTQNKPILKTFTMG
jgi:hypothetical protein